MKKTHYMLEMLLGKPLREASDEKVLKLLVLLAAEFTLNKAHKVWVGGAKRDGLSSRRIDDMMQVLFRETKRRMKK